MIILCTIVSIELLWLIDIKISDYYAKKTGEMTKEVLHIKNIKEKENDKNG